MIEINIIYSYSSELKMKYIEIFHHRVNDSPYQENSVNHSHA
jgi:hypothetical protein